MQGCTQIPPPPPFPFPPWSLPASPHISSSAAPRPPSVPPADVPHHHAHVPTHHGPRSETHHESGTCNHIVIPLCKHCFLLLQGRHSQNKYHFLLHLLNNNYADTHLVYGARPLSHCARSSGRGIGKSELKYHSWWKILWTQWTGIKQASIRFNSSPITAGDSIPPQLAKLRWLGLTDFFHSATQKKIYS